MLGDLHKQLGKVGHCPALLCVAVKRNSAQRRTYFTSESLGDAMLGDLHKQLGKVGHCPALLCVAVKQILNGIAVDPVNSITQIVESA